MTSFIKNHRYILFIVLALLIVARVAVDYAYKASFLKRKDDAIVHRETTENGLSVYNALKVIDDNRLDYLDVLGITFDSPSSISNQNLLKLSYFYNKNVLDFKEGVSSSKFEEYLTKIFGNIDITNESVGNFLTYDRLNDIYKQSDSPDKVYEIFPVFYFITSFDSEDDYYVLKIHKFYENRNKVYTSYNDLLNDTNSLFTVPEGEKVVPYIKSVLSTNYSSLFDKMSLYTYNFSKYKSYVILKSYSVTK